MAASFLALRMVCTTAYILASEAKNLERNFAWRTWDALHLSDVMEHLIAYILTNLSARIRLNIFWIKTALQFLIENFLISIIFANLHLIITGRNPSEIFLRA